ncbi:MULTISPECIES: DUF1659 domain-containing protein [Salimicrobium]|uniref:DUF1659 domain-containing protein n=4 Tax=Salimicrobium TaxID=351195 RepID=K2GJW1_9BACI|nr:MULTISPECIES: DUF1659 domain-containing protein [Salimicrobium]AKG03436.1 hypothetical protein AAV35_000665 [Salimicrobium jeotgali]EKE30729.1 hypothetical protein MJ3_12205 [Salimicrobium jeotgali]MBM7697142.1 hypothetical protein [Salimicrobium jeotgali]PBB06903.1 DUF1659 domain-containing protein [Salimicrobium humidisoli]SDY28428.1 Protein of unknown function [Salimicrobium album]
MALMTQRINSTLKLDFETGVDELGQPVYKTKSFRNVRTEATAEALYAVAEKLESLQQYPLYEVTRDDESSIVHIQD